MKYSEPTTQDRRRLAIQEPHNVLKPLEVFWGKPSRHYYYIAIPVSDLPQFLEEYKIEAPENKEFTLVPDVPDHPTVVRSLGNNENMLLTPDEPVAIIALDISEDENLNYIGSAPRTRLQSKNEKVSTSCIFTSSIRAIIPPLGFENEVRELVVATMMNIIEPLHIKALQDKHQEHIIQQRQLENLPSEGESFRLIEIPSVATLPGLEDVAANYQSLGIIVVGIDEWLDYINATLGDDPQTALEKGIDRRRKQRPPDFADIFGILEKAIELHGVYFMENGRISEQLRSGESVAVVNAREALFSQSQPPELGTRIDRRPIEQSIYSEIGNLPEIAMLIHEIAVLVKDPRMNQIFWFDSLNYDQDFGVRLRQIGMKYDIFTDNIKNNNYLLGDRDIRQQIMDWILLELPDEKNYVDMKRVELEEVFKVLAEDDSLGWTSAKRAYQVIYGKLAKRERIFTTENRSTERERIIQSILLINSEYGTELSGSLQCFNSLQEETMRKLSDATLEFLYLTYNRVAVLKNWR